MIEGLYVTIRPDGKIEKHLSTKDGEVPFPAQTIAEELIELSERNYIFCFIYRKRLLSTINGLNPDLNVIAAVEDICEQMKQKNVICGTLAHYEFWDRYHYWVPEKSNSLSRLTDAAIHFGSAAKAWQHTYTVLNQLSEKTQAGVRNLSATYFTVMTYGKPNTYVFRSEAQYYYFLLQRLLESKVRICKCQFCGLFFVPRTKHKTLYCDRVVRNGKTCKEIAPYLKRKERIEANKVLLLFEHAKDTMFRRFERTGSDKAQSVVDLTYDQYIDWLNSATDARNRYLAGKLTEEDAMAIIYVPRKDELTGDNSSELTLETAAT